MDLDDEELFGVFEDGNEGGANKAAEGGEEEAAVDEGKAMRYVSVLAPDDDLKKSDLLACLLTLPLYFLALILWWLQFWAEIKV